MVRHQLSIIGNGKDNFFSQLGQMLPKSKPQQLGVIIPDLNCQGMFSIVRSAL